MIELKETPTQIYHIGEHKVYVKREDLCAPKGAPPFSKIRGLVKHLAKLKDRGVRVVGYTETSISMAGWGVAWAGKYLGLKVVIFNPVYKDVHPELEYHRYEWRVNNAEIINIKAGMAKVNYNISKRMLKDIYGDSAVMLPLGLPLSETIEATTEEFKKTSILFGTKSVVVNVGSGTICYGIYRGMDSNMQLFGIMGRTGRVDRKRKKIVGEPSIFDKGNYPDFHLIDPGYQYTEAVDTEVPFPCNKYYDAKAWDWLEKNVYWIAKPILFWNIGGNSVK